MCIRFGIGCVSVVFLFSSGLALAGDNNSIQGTLRDTDGVLLVAGNITAERNDAKAKPVITKTDDHGQYVFKGLPAGTYTVTAYVDDIPRARAKVQTNSKGWTKLDFNLRE